MIADETDEAREGDSAAGLANPGLFGIVHELGQNATVFPDHVGVKLPANSVLTYRNTHLHSIGRRVRARLDTAFTFQPRGHAPRYRQTTGAQAGGSIRGTGRAGATGRSTTCSTTCRA